MTVRTTTKIQPSHESQPLTGEDLFTMGDIGRSELVKGELIQLAPAGHPHGYYEGNFVIELGSFVREHKLGKILSGEVGIYTGRNPDTVRGADVAFISYERLAQVQSHSYLDMAPELIVEVLSPDDRWSEIEKKLDEYFNIDVQVVWVADPKQRQIHVYHSLSEAKILESQDVLTGDDLLSGFSVPVAELFA